MALRTRRVMAADTKKPPKLAVPLAVWPAIGVVLLTALVAGYRLIGDDELVLVPRGNLAPGQLITYADIIPKKVDGYGLGDVVRSRSEVVNRVAQRPLERGKPIAKAALTGRVPSGYPTRVRVHFRVDQVATDGVEAGGPVELFFAPAWAPRAQ